MVFFHQFIHFLLKNVERARKSALTKDGLGSFNIDDVPKSTVNFMSKWLVIFKSFQRLKKTFELIKNHFDVL